MSTQTPTLPPLPEWSLRDDLGGLVPSDIRSELKAYARAAIAAQAQRPMVKVRFRRAHCEDEIIIPATDDPKKHVQESLILGVSPVEHQQAQGVPADAALSIVRRFERMVGDYNCLFTEYQGKTMPADVYQRFTALREERIPTARKELAALLAAAPQAEPVKPAPSGWLKFDSANPPDEGVYWVHFEAPEIDGDVDNYGRTVDVHTGETEHTIAMAHLITDGEGAFAFHDVDNWNLGKRPSLGVARHYMPVVLPSAPGAQAPAASAEPQPEREPFTADVECVTDESGTDYSVAVRGPGIRNPLYSDVWLKKERKAAMLAKWLNDSVFPTMAGIGAKGGDKP